MTVAVTGASGFLGRAVCAALLIRGEPVRGLVRAGSVCPDGVEEVAGDLGDPVALAALVQRVDAVIHCAALMGSSDGAALNRVNVQGTRSVLGAARAAGVARFVLVSSVAAGRPEHGAYSASKQAAEAVARAGADASCAVLILRPPVLTGPGSQVERVVLGLARRGLLPAIAGGAPLRPLPVDDAAAACVHAALGVEPSGTRTLAGPEALDFPTLCRRILREHRRRALVLPVPGLVARGIAGVAELLLSAPPLTTEGVRAVLAGSPPPGSAP